MDQRSAGGDRPRLDVARGWLAHTDGQPRVWLPDAADALSETVDVGTIELMNSINTQAAKKPEHEYTRLVFIDSLSPPAWGRTASPYEMAVKYKARLRLEGGSGVTQAIETLLPIVKPPRQAPEIVAAGIR